MTDTATYAMSAMGTAAGLVLLPILLIRLVDKVSEFHARGMARLAATETRGQR